MMRCRRRRLKEKAIPAPSRGRGPGAELGPGTGGIGGLGVVSRIWTLSRSRKGGKLPLPVAALPQASKDRVAVALVGVKGELV